MKIAFIGMGIMGSAMASRIAASGVDTVVYNRSQANPNINKAIASGAYLASTIEEAVSNVDVVALCLGDENSVRSVLLGSEGVCKCVKPGTTILDFTTIGPRATAALAHDLNEHEIKFIDAPITGGPPAAETGTLTIMLGGDEETSSKLSPILAPVSSKVVAVGKTGSGQALKMVNQLLCAVNLAGVCAALKAAEALGVEGDKVLDACSGGAAGSWQLSNLGSKILEEDFAPGFKVEHMRKDLRLLKESLDQNTPELATLAMAYFDELLNQSPQSAELGTQSLIKIFK